MSTNISPEIVLFQEQRANLVHDPQRPLYHFLAPANWMNDPNGLIQWQGKYHLFYQYNPNGPFHGTIHWGHAVSEDLIHWLDLPIALAPTPGEFDEEGCWSGCALNHDGLPTLVYSGVFPQVVCLATSTDGLKTWQKHPSNPVIASPPGEFGHHSGGHFRDPFVWWEDDRYYLLMGTKYEGVGGVILLYESDDLLDWRYLNPFLIGDVNQHEPFWTASMWECPNLLHFGDKRVLIFSVQSARGELLYAVYYIGEMKEHRFAPKTGAKLVYGDCFYAPQVMRVDDGRYLMFGWLKEGRSPRLCHEAGWSGAMSSPIEITLSRDGTLGLSPVVEMNSLRTIGWHFEELLFKANSEWIAPDVVGACLDLTAVFIPDDSTTECGLIIRCSADGEEQTRIVYQPEHERIVIERAQSSLEDEVDKHPCSAPLNSKSNEPLQLRVLLDNSIIELFVNERVCLFSRIYPAKEDSIGVGVFARNGQVRLKFLDVWQMKSVWNVAD